MMDGESASLSHKKLRDGLTFSLQIEYTKSQRESVTDRIRSTARRSVIPKSRGGAVGVVESKLESAGIPGTPTPKGRRARAENTGGGRQGSEEPELDFAGGGRQVWK